MLSTLIEADNDNQENDSLTTASKGSTISKKLTVILRREYCSYSG